jgi:uncharacterized protein (DUF697 family)
MRLLDPTAKATFVVRLVGESGVGKSALVAALMDVPIATDDELARLRFEEGGQAEDVADAVVAVVRGLPDPVSRDALSGAVAAARESRGEAQAKPPALFVAVHACDLSETPEPLLRESWAKVAPEARVYLTSTPPLAAARGVDDLRTALLEAALVGLDASIERTRRAKRPYATAIVSGAALATAGEALFPGAAALVVATQVGAITSLYYLYTGKWLGRAQAAGVIPAFAGEFLGGTAFLVAKSFLPPTGIADVIAASVAVSMTIAMLGTITIALEQGYSLDQKERLMLVFRRLKAKTRAERANIARQRHLWKEKSFWTDAVRRILFDG